MNTTLLAPFTCFVCKTRTSRDGAGSITDPYVIADHDNSDGVRCTQSGQKWLSL